MEKNKVPEFGNITGILSFTGLITILQFLQFYMAVRTENCSPPPAFTQGKLSSMYRGKLTYV